MVYSKMANRNRQPTARPQMGSGNSQPQTHGNSVIDEPDGTFPFQIRRDAVHQLQLVFDKVSDSHQWAETYQQKIDAVKQELLINESIKQLDNSSVSIVDKTSLDMSSLIEDTVRKKAPDWQTECQLLSQVLASHVSPPHIPGNIPQIEASNLTHLNLVNIRIKTQTGIDGLTTLLQKNKSLEKLELGYTCITTQTYLQVHKGIVKLQQLTYLGLRGNRLDNTVVQTFNKNLQNKKTLPRLLWIDFANNIDIVTIPTSLLTLLQQRWPQGSHYHPTYRELLDSKIVVHEALFAINL